jgi:hypothetical protein
MLRITSQDHIQDKYQEDIMNAYNLRFQPVSPAIKALAERLRQEPPIDRTPRLTGMDEAVLRAQAQNGGV